MPPALCRDRRGKMMVPVAATRWRAAGLILLGLLAPGGSLIVLSMLLGKRMWGGWLSAMIVRKDESR